MEQLKTVSLLEGNRQVWDALDKIYKQLNKLPTPKDWADYRATLIPEVSQALAQLGHIEAFRKIWSFKNWFYQKYHQEFVHFNMKKNLPENIFNFYLKMFNIRPENEKPNMQKS